jgi:peptidyl-prolyl cis-trans isomerase C
LIQYRQGQHLLEHKNQYWWKIVLTDKIKCSHILVKKQSEALTIFERLKKGESFANLARELSVDRGNAKKGGDLGFFGRGVMVRTFEDAAFKLGKGEISEPVKTEFGYHIIKRAGG